MTQLFTITDDILVSIVERRIEAWYHEDHVKVTVQLHGLRSMESVREDNGMHIRMHGYIWIFEGDKTANEDITVFISKDLTITIYSERNPGKPSRIDGSLDWGI